MRHIEKIERVTFRGFVSVSFGPFAWV